jgi:hypothetical protein
VNAKTKRKSSKKTRVLSPEDQDRVNRIVSLRVRCGLQQDWLAEAGELPQRERYSAFESGASRLTTLKSHGQFGGCWGFTQEEATAFLKGKMTEDEAVAKTARHVEAIRERQRVRGAIGDIMERNLKKKPIDPGLVDVAKAFAEVYVLKHRSSNGDLEAVVREVAAELEAMLYNLPIHSARAPTRTD